MLLRLLTASLLIMQICAFADGAHVVNLNAYAEGGYRSFTGATHYVFLPQITVTEDGVETNDVVTLTSPGGLFEGYVNHPEGTNGSTLFVPTSAGVVAEVNGTWQLSLKDVVADVTYLYEVDMSFTLPFAAIPSFASSSLVNDQPVGTFDWSLNGGSPAFPGPASTIFARLLDDAFPPAIDEESLPITATSWTPEGDFAGASGLRGIIFTSNEAVDAISLMVTDVRAIETGQPELTFGPSTVRYGARRDANLTAVPEPASGLAAIIGLGIAALCYRHGKRAL